MSGTKDNVSIIVIVNNSLLRDGLSHILSGEGYKVVASASVLDADILSRLKPDESSLLVLLGSADRKDTAEQLKLYREQQQNGCSVIIAERDEPDDIITALQAGANACLTKDKTSDAFLKTIELVMLGDTVVPHALLPHLLKREEDWATGMAPDNPSPMPGLDAASSLHPPVDAKSPDAIRQLSAQERRILSCLIIGDPNKTIARKADIAEATVKVHVKAILRKLRLKNRTQAAVWGLNRGSNSQNVAPKSSDSSAIRLYQQSFQLTREALPRHEVSDALDEEAGVTSEPTKQ
jgi:two-component system nitrate/nitrite response regulator NarL